MENSEYGRLTLRTLIAIASALDVALAVRFVDYPTMLGIEIDAASLRVNTIHETVESVREVRRW